MMAMRLLHGACVDNESGSLVAARQSLTSAFPAHLGQYIVHLMVDNNFGKCGPIFKILSMQFDGKTRSN